MRETPVYMAFRAVLEPQMYANDTQLIFAGNNLDIIEQKLNQNVIDPKQNLW